MDDLPLQMSNGYQTDPDTSEKKNVLVEKASKLKRFAVLMKPARPDTYGPRADWIT